MEGFGGASSFSVKCGGMGMADVFNLAVVEGCRWRILRWCRMFLNGANGLHGGGCMNRNMWLLTRKSEKSAIRKQ